MPSSSAHRASVLQVVRDLERLLAMAAGTHAIAVDGIRLEYKQLRNLPVDPANPDPLIYFGTGDPNDPSHDEWESWVRPRLADAQGCDVKKIEVAVFGDLRRIRNDIIHNGGTASEKWTGKCRVLRWFVPGHPIAIKAEHVAEFMALVPLDDLRKPVC